MDFVLLKCVIQMLLNLTSKTVLLISFFFFSYSEIACSLAVVLTQWSNMCLFYL